MPKQKKSTRLKIKREIKKLVSYANAARNKTEKSILWGNINPITDNEIFHKSGLNIEDYSYEIDSSSIRHILNQHGNKNREEKLKQIPVTKRDILLIPEIIEKYDIIQKVTKKTKKGTYSILFIKQIGKKYYVVFEIRRKKRTLALKTMYIKRSSI